MRRGEGNQREVVRLVASPVGGCGAAFVTIAEGCFVTMVTIGDIEHLQFESGVERLDRSWIVDQAERVLLAVFPVEFSHRRGRRGALERALHPAIVVTINEEDGASVGPDRAEEAQAVFLRSAERLLVREHYPLIPRLEAQAGEQDPAAVRDAIALKLLIVDVEGGRVVADQRSVAPPAVQRCRGALITTAAVSFSKLDVDGVERRALVEDALLLRRDDVERGRDGVGEVEVGCVSECAEGADVSHVAMIAPPNCGGERASLE